MPQCQLVINDEVNCQFIGLDDDTVGALKETLTFVVPGARYTPAFTLGRWDGKTSLMSSTGRSYVHVIDGVVDLLHEAGYEIDVVDERVSDGISLDPIDESYTKGCYNRKSGREIVLRDYQIEAVNAALALRAGSFIMATSSGKSYVCGCIARKFMEHGKVIVIVPSKTLVRQTSADFVDVGIKDCGRFYGDVKDPQQVTVTTWQSLQNYPELLADVVCVIGDEAHGCKARVLTELLGVAGRNIPHRYGFTGTLPDDELGRLQVISLLGPPVMSVRAHDLQKKGIIADCEIMVLQTQETSHPLFQDFQDEYGWLVKDEKRLRWAADVITTMAESAPAAGNTLVLVERVASGKELAKILGDRAVFIYGGTSAKNREKEYEAINRSNGGILVATKGIAAVGIDVPRLYNAVLFEIGKSFTQVIQSIGRLLRKADDKTDAVILDICASTKYSKRHLTTRIRYYKREKYRHQVIKVSYDRTDESVFA